MVHHDDYYVVLCYPSGVKRTVVERENNILTRDEALKHERQCNQAMLDELRRWLNLGEHLNAAQMSMLATPSMRDGFSSGKW